MVKITSYWWFYFLTGHVDAKNAIGSFVDNPVVFADFETDSV
jgi:hypothetical protein